MNGNRSVSRFVSHPAVLAALALSAAGCGDLPMDGVGQSEVVADRRSALDSTVLSDYAKKSILVSGVPVVDNSTRAAEPCSATSTDAQKVWSFGYLLTQASSTSPTTNTASRLIAHWLDTWTTTQSINNQTIQPFTNDPDPNAKSVGQVIKDEWPKVSGTTMYNMNYAPFRLLAIVPRFDLRRKRRFQEGLAGELRFVFGIVKYKDSVGGCSVLPDDTVILEFAVDKATENDVLAWAKSWDGLPAFGTASYLSSLEGFTQSVVQKGKGSPFGRPNGSELIRLRTNTNPNTNGIWEMREWDLSSSTGLLEPATVKQTPAPEMRRSDPPNPLVGQWANNNETAILNDTYSVPNSYNGSPLLGGHELNDVDGGFNSNGVSTNVWSAGFNDNNVRFQFGLNTCTGCHRGETAGVFAHIQPRPIGQESALSSFLTGVNDDGSPFSVIDPVDPSVTHAFHVIDDRAADLTALASGYVVPMPQAIPTPALATYFKLLNNNSAKCVDMGGSSAGVSAQQWSCSGAGNQRFAAIALTNGYYNIRVKQGNYCLQAASAPNSSGQWLVTQQVCSSSATSQQAQITPLYQDYPYYMVTFRNTGRCLELSDSNNGTKALQKTCSFGVPPQVFYFVE